MAYARTRFSIVSNAAKRTAGSREERLADEEQSEIDTLRAVNARLLSELSALRAREAQIQRLADRDGLTGLYNRRRMLELLESAISAARDEQHSVGLLFVDLNGFKSINDEYGHGAGDKILATVATRICARVRVGDFVSRYGGDEFVVILPNVPDPLAVSKVADTIRERVSLPYWINGKEQHMTAAIGESMYPYDGDTAAALLLRADQSMYRLKSHLDARSSFSVGWVPAPGMARRRNDKCKSRPNGA